MLKKLLTGCLTIVAAAALAVPAMAAEMSGKVGGRAAADLVSKSSTPGGGDSVNYMDIESEGRLNYTLTATEGAWTSTGLFEIRSNNGDNYKSNPIVLQKYFQIENEAVSIALGTKVWGFVYLTPYMGVSSSWDRYCYGCGSLTGKFGLSSDYRDDRLEVAIKQVGLRFYYASTLKDETVDFDADSTTANSVDFKSMQKTSVGLQYNGAFGPVTLVAAYQSKSWKAIENKGTADTVLDGTTNSELALAVRYAIMEGMFVEADYETAALTYGNAGTGVTDDTRTWNAMGLAFAMAFSETQGFVFSYDSVTTNSGVESADDTVATEMVASFNQKIGGQQVWVAYEADSTKAGDEDADVESTIALGGRVSF